MQLALRRGLAAATTLMLAVPLAADLRDSSDDGPTVFLESAIAVDDGRGTVTLPLREGRHDGDVVWYVVTEASDRRTARARGVNAAPRLVNALGTAAVQQGSLADGLLVFTGTVDFSPERVLVPGPDGFPPAELAAGAVGDEAYSPLVTVDDQTVLNASHVANDSGVHDAVIDIDYDARTVTLDTINGFYEGNQVQYLHQEASVELVAAVEGSTWAPLLDAAPEIGSNDPRTSARAAIIPIVNGLRLREDMFQWQGLQTALLDRIDPLNITQVIPGERDYTPVWDVTPAVWTDEAIANGDRERLTDHEDVADLVASGLLTNGGTGPPNESLEGLLTLPGISNCPIVLEFD